MMIDPIKHIAAVARLCKEAPQVRIQWFVLVLEGLVLFLLLKPLKAIKRFLPLMLGIILVGGASLPSQAVPLTSYIKSVEYVEITLSGTSSGSANLGKGQTIANCVPFVTIGTSAVNDDPTRFLTDIQFESGTPNKVTATRDSTSGTLYLGITVVEFDVSKVDVQQGVFDFSSTETSITSDDTGMTAISAVTLSKAALVSYYRTNGGTSDDFDEYMVAGWFADSDTLNWQRDASGRALQGHYYVFEAVNSEFAVQAKNFSISSGSSTGSVTLDSGTDAGKTFLIASYRTSHPWDDADKALINVYLDTATPPVVQGYRYSSSDAISDVRVFAVEFAAGGDESVQRGNFSYTSSDATKEATLTTAVSSFNAMAWNVVNPPGAMRLDNANGVKNEDGWQRLKFIENGTKIQGQRWDENAVAVGSWEVVEWGDWSTDVTLASFTAIGEGNHVRVAWETAQETDNFGFNLYRATSRGGPFVKLNAKLIPGLNFSIRGQAYSYLDKDVVPGTLYYYKLEDIDVFGKRTLHGPICVDWDADGLPDDWEIGHGLNPWVNDAGDDPDRDGLTNFEEYERGFDPFNPDSDGDGTLDGQESLKIERTESKTTRSLSHGIEVLAEDESGITLELSTEAFGSEVVYAGGQEFERLRIAEYIHGHTHEVGKPQMPVKGILLDLPEDTAVSMSILSTEVKTHSGYQIFPVPENVLDEQGGASAVGEAFVWDESAYSIDAFYPQDVIRLGEVFVFRGQNKQQVLFYPLSFNPASGQLRQYRKIKVRIDYEANHLAMAADVPPAPWKPPVSKGALADVSTLAPIAAAFGAASMPLPALLPALSSLELITQALWTPPDADQYPTYKILVDAEGIFHITRNFLSNQGLTDPEINAIDLSQVRLFYLGEEQTIHIEDGDTPDQIDANDYIAFYGQVPAAAYAKYARYNVYWLTTAAGSGQPKRMLDIDGSPAAGVLGTNHGAITRAEQNRRYFLLAPGDDDRERWFYNEWVLGDELPGGGNPVDFAVALPHPDGLATLTVSMVGSRDAEHEIDIAVNGTTLDTVFWSGINFYEAVINDVDFIGSVSERNAQAATANSITLAADAAAIDDQYNQMQVEITSGVGSGQRRTIIDYDGTSKVATVDTAWNPIPDGTSIYRLADTVSLTCQSGEDSVLVDFFEVSYPQQFVAYNDSLKFTHDSGYRYQITDFSTDALMVFDISDTDNVGQVINFTTAGSGPFSLEFEPPVNPGASETFWVLRADGWQTPAGLEQDNAADLGDIANGADYILITHRDLGWDGNGDAYGWLEDLAALRQAQGLRVEVIDVQDIFDEFSYGLFSPQAIKDFLSYAYSNWDEPGPSYVLLVGDSTYDPKDIIGLGDATPYLPAYLAFTEYMGETVTDEWYVRISGADAVPDMYIGRLPAASVADAEVMVAKIDAYEAALKDKTWQANTVFVADDETEEYEAIFKTMNDDTAALLPAAMGISAGYLDDYLTVNALTADIIGWINSGALLVNYGGHGNTNYWAAGPIFHVDDVAALTNADKYPFFVSMSCLSGQFTYPQPYGFYSLMEVLLRSANKGAVAALMPTGKTTTGGQYILDTALFETIFTDDVRLLGPAIAQAKQTLLANGSSQYEELSETFLLFGDPALTLKIPLPRRPAGLTVQVIDQTVALSWQAATDYYGQAVEGYNLYRSTSAGGSYSLLNTELITDTDFEDPTAQIGVTYYYGVTSVDTDGDESAQALGVSSATLGAPSGSGGGGGGGCFISSTANCYSCNEKLDGILTILISCIGLLLLVGIGLFFWYVLSVRSKNIDNSKMMAGHNI